MSEQPDSNKIKSTAEKLLEQQAERDNQNALALENLQEYVKALNAVAETPNGQHVLKIWIKALGVFAVKPNRDAAALVVEKANRDFYLTYIRPHLDQTVRQIIES